MSFFGTEIGVFQIDVKSRNLRDDSFFGNVEEKKSIAGDHSILFHPAPFLDPLWFWDRHVTDVNRALVAQEIGGLVAQSEGPDGLGLALFRGQFANLGGLLGTADMTRQVTFLANNTLLSLINLVLLL